VETHPTVPGAPTQTQSQPTLEEYAVGVDQINTDLQWQSAAYGHFREVLTQIDAIVSDPQHSDRMRLPFVIVRFPQKGPAPGEMKFDMNALPPEALPEFRPLFERLAGQAGDRLVTAWSNMHGVADATKPIIAAARRVSG